MYISPLQSNPNCSFNIKNLCALLSMIFVTVASIAYMLFDSKSLLEFGKCFNTVVSLAEIILYFLVQVSKMTKIQNLISDFERFIKKSK